MDLTISAARGDRAVPEDVGRERPLRPVGDQSRVKYLYAGIGERRDPAGLAATDDPPVAAEIEIAHAAVIVGARERHHQQKRVHLGVVPARCQQPDRVDRPVDPKVVAVDHQHRRVAQQMPRLDEPAARLHQHFPLVGDHDVDPREPIGDVRLQRVRKVVHVDDRALDPGGLQSLEHVIDQRFPCNLNQRLGSRRGQRAHPLAQSRSHHHRCLGHDPTRDRADRLLAGHAPSASGSPRNSGGTFAANHAATGAMTGWARSRSRYVQTRGHIFA